MASSKLRIEDLQPGPPHLAPRSTWSPALRKSSIVNNPSSIRRPLLRKTNPISRTPNFPELPAKARLMDNLGEMARCKTNPNEPNPPKPDPARPRALALPGTPQQLLRTDRRARCYTARQTRTAAEIASWPLVWASCAGSFSPDPSFFCRKSRASRTMY